MVELKDRETQFVEYKKKDILWKKLVKVFNEYVDNTIGKMITEKLGLHPARKPKYYSTDSSYKDYEDMIKDIISLWRTHKVDLATILHQKLKIRTDKFEQVKIIEKRLKKYDTAISLLEKELATSGMSLKKMEKFKIFSSLYIENFKGFTEREDKKKNTIDIKPITLIYGPNSYGKSSIIQTLLLLHQTIKKEGGDYENVYLCPEGSFTGLGVYYDFVNNNDVKKSIKIEFSLPVNVEDDTISRKTAGFSYKLNNQERIVLSKIELSDKKIFPADSDESPTREFFLKPNNLYSYESECFQPYNRTSFLKIRGFKNNIIHPYFAYNDGDIFDYIEDTIRELVYVSSYRKAPERYFIPSENDMDYVGKYGQYTANIINNDQKLRMLVSKWLLYIAGYELSSRDNKTRFDSVNLNDKKTHIKKLNLTDLGSGIAQVLPIITQAFKSEYKMILIEEPEIHLHPKAQAELGEMFAESALTRNNTFIIETHSENLMLRLGNLIRNKKLSKDDVSIIYIDKDEKGSYCIPLRFDEEGDIENIKDVPDGFFEEGYKEMFLPYENKKEVNL